MTITLIFATRRGLIASLASLGVAAPILLVAGLSYLWPAQSNGLSHRELAGLIRSKIGGGAVAWWGENDSLCLTFYMQQIMPSFDENPATPAAVPDGDTPLISLDPIEAATATPTGYSVALTMPVRDERLFVFTPHR